MAVPPYISGLPPGIQQDFLNNWSDLQGSFAQQQPLPPVAPTSPSPFPHVSSAHTHADPLEGSWVTQGGAWHFTRDKDGYAMIETSALGQVGQGRAVLTGQTLAVDYHNGILGRVHRTLTLDGNTLQGSASLFGMTIPLYLQRV